MNRTFPGAIFAVSLTVVVITTGGRLYGSVRTEVAKVRNRLSGRAPHWSNGVSGPLCGVYSTCTAMRLSGFQCSPADYFTTSYVGSSGSTPEQIASIAESVGAKAISVSNMSLFDLRWLDAPLIANVRSTPQSKAYDHWVVVTLHDGNLILYDALQPPMKARTAEFLASWSGVGVVSKRDEAVLPRVWAGRLVIVQLGVLIALGITAALRRFAHQSRSLPHQMGAVFVVAVVLTAVGMTVLGDWPHHFSGVRLAAAPYSEKSYRSASLGELHTIVQTQEALLIDARLRANYLSGTLPGAVNVPVQASLWEIRQYLEGIRRDVPVVVFCQSARCTWDKTVAANLTLLGFTNVTVCKKGWAEYQEKYRS